MHGRSQKHKGTVPDTGNSNLVTAEDKNIRCKVNGRRYHHRSSNDRDLKIYGSAEVYARGHRAKEQQPSDTKKKVLDGLISRELLLAGAKPRTCWSMTKRYEELDKVYAAGLPPRKSSSRKLNEGGFYRG